MLVWLGLMGVLTQEACMNVDGTNAGPGGKPAGSPASAEQKPAGPGTPSAEPDLAAPPITLEVFPEYMIGFPMLVAITCENPTAKSTFYNLPEANIFTAPGPIEFIFTSPDGKRIVLPAASPRHKETARGFTLRPGEARRMLFDISGLEPSLEPGPYRLEAIYRLKSGSSTSPPAQVRITTPAPEDARAAATLKRENDTGEPSWSQFIEANWRTVDAAKLSAKGREALAYHLFLHRAIYGPARVRDLELGRLEAFARGPLAGEAAVLRLEILAARGAQTAAEEAAILKQWPGLRWRIDEIKAGGGLLASLRRTLGAEQEFDKKPDFYPYTTKP